jgi:hypothetical protein
MADDQVTFSPLDMRTPQQRREQEHQERERNRREADVRQERRQQAELTARDAAEVNAGARAELGRLARSIDGHLADQAEENAAGAARNARRNLERSVTDTPDGPGRIAAERKALAALRRAKEWHGFSRELRSASVVAEPAIYGPHSEASFFLDLAAVSVLPQLAQRTGMREAAAERLRRSDRREILDNPIRVDRVLRDKTRMEIGARTQSEKLFKELRTGITSGASSGGAFVTPAYLLGDYAVFREYAPIFAEQGCTNKPLPAYGLKLYVPAFTSPADGGEQPGEGNAISEVDPTATLRAADVATLESLINVSQELVDRVGPGHGLDEFLFAQMMQKLDQQLDAKAITTALTGVTPATRTSAFSANEVADGYLSDLGRMASSLATTSGVKLPPSAQFVQPNWGEWLVSQTGTDHRPIFPFVGGTGSRADGFTGFAPSAIPLYLDGSIPASSGDAQLIVSNRAGIYIYAGEPLLQMFPEPGASNLEVLVRCYRYCCVLVRYPGATAVTTGAAYPLSPTWA